ncbi:leucine-rich repeat and transmembrane domain-containing protein 2-like [Anneissia japonica]|uniref:leucine-rich repeat and transmembrane domain-containing protein 2-like n=1 Tax=Anneissia japonica TaxID=1529436 RepID=UPI0014257690|nr:leucine-rich repeat and transmembrane domain-containing protein 2-like [Anneissia japonica]
MSKSIWTLWLQLVLFQLSCQLSWQQLDNPIETLPGPLLITSLPSIPVACNSWKDGVCKCSEFEKLVDCGNLNLQYFPIGIPNDTQALDVKYNLISSVPDLLHLTKLQQIDLRSNNLNKVPRLPKTINAINLSNNKIQNFSTEFMGMSSLFELKMDYNSIEYLPVGGFRGCGSLFSLYIRDNRIKILNGSNLEGLDSISEL